MSPLFWLFLGYSAIWVGLLLFVMRLGRKQEEMFRQLEELERSVSRRGR